MTTRRAAASDRETLRISGPADMVRMAPYLLGFHPKESLVIVGLANRAIVVTVRIDLADLVDDTFANVLSGTIAAMVRGGARVLMGMVFDDRAEPPAHPDPLPWHGLASAIATESTFADAVVDDVMLVSRRRWWSYTCDDPDCCPPEGTPLDDESSWVDAAAAYAGLVALPDRAALAELLEPERAGYRDRLLPRLAAAKAELKRAADQRGAERSVKRELFALARRSDEPGAGIALPDEDIARFGAALATSAIRDAAWLAVDDDRLDGRALWRYLGRQLPGRYAATPMFVFGWASWRAGNGALARIAAERALAADPACSAADLLLAALSRGCDPRQVPKLRQRTA